MLKSQGKIAVLDFVRRVPHSSCREIAEELQFSYAKVYNALNYLRHYKYIRRVNCSVPYRYETTAERVKVLS